MPHRADQGLSLREVLEHLEAIQDRLGRTEQIGGPEQALRVLALAGQVRRLCDRAAYADDEAEVRALLNTAINYLEELRLLLGPR